MPNKNEDPEKRAARLEQALYRRVKAELVDVRMKRLHGRIYFEAIVTDGLLTYVESGRRDGEK